MADVFISFAKEDEKLAQFLYNHFVSEGLTVFKAPVSIPPGEKWTPQIFKNLKDSRMVLFLASKAACISPYVQQELGVALGMEKKVIPVVWDMDPAELPGWTNQLQALNLKGITTLDEIRQNVSVISKQLKGDKKNDQGIVIILIAFALLLLMKNE